MAQERPLTPEKQLLRLIENSSAKSAGIETQKIRYRVFSFFSWGALRGRISFLKEKVFKWLRSRKSQQVEINIVNRVLYLILIILACYFAVDFYKSAVKLRKVSSLGSYGKDEASGKMISSRGVALVEKRASEYLGRINERDIFKMGVSKTETNESSKAPTAQIIEATQNLKLVGISWSNDPDAMIEDTKAIKTFFVKRNGIMGEVKVQAIFKDKVILSYRGEEIELK